MYLVFQKVKFTTLGRQFQFKFYDFCWSSLDIIDDASSEASYNFLLETLVHFYNFEVSYFEIHTPHAHYPIDIHHHTSIDHFLGGNQHKILRYGFHSLLSLKKEHWRKRLGSAWNEYTISTQLTINNLEIVKIFSRSFWCTSRGIFYTNWKI